MTAKKLTIEAFKLYDSIRTQSYQHSDNSRLYFVGLRAFYRYKRRLKAE
jgi:hypothetical protein